MILRKFPTKLHPQLIFSAHFPFFCREKSEWEKSLTVGQQSISSGTAACPWTGSKASSLTLAPHARPRSHTALAHNHPIFPFLRFNFFLSCVLFRRFAFVAADAAAGSRPKRKFLDFSVVEIHRKNGYCAWGFFLGNFGGVLGFRTWRNFCYLKFLIVLREFSVLE